MNWLEAAACIMLLARGTILGAAFGAELVEDLGRARRGGGADACQDVEEGREEPWDLCVRVLPAAGFLPRIASITCSGRFRGVLADGEAFGVASTDVPVGRRTYRVPHRSQIRIRIPAAP